MSLPSYIQNCLRQYDNNELSWGGVNNSKLMDQLVKGVQNNNDEKYVKSRRFAKDMREFASRIYTTAQLQSDPAPMPFRTCWNAIKCLRRKIK